MNAPATTEKLVICDLAQLGDFRSREAWQNRTSRTDLVLHLGELSAAENKEWTEKLRSPYHACGCPASAVGLLLGLAGYLAFVAATKGFSSSGWFEAGVGLLIVVVASGIGKIVGLGWARFQFGRLLKTLAVVATARNVTHLK